MILSDIKKYLMARRRTAVEDIALHFDTDVDAVRGMLTQWIRKGRVVRIETAVAGCASACPSCCCGKAPEIYEWLK